MVDKSNFMGQISHFGAKPISQGRQKCLFYGLDWKIPKIKQKREKIVIKQIRSYL